MLTFAAILLYLSPGELPPADSTVDPDEVVLRSAGIDCGNDSLLAFLAALKPDQKLLARIDALIAQLGVEKFSERNAAFRELVRIGLAARPALLKADQNPSAEIRKAAGRCLEETAFKKPLPPTASAAPRVPGNSNTPGAIS